MVTLDGVHMLLDRDVDDADRGVEQEKLEPTVIVCDTCGRCEKKARQRGRQPQQSESFLSVAVMMTLLLLL